MGGMSGGTSGGMTGGMTGGMSAGVSGGVGEDVLLARAFLNRIAEPASVPLWWAVRQEGPVEVARAIRAGRAVPLVRETHQHPLHGGHSRE